MLRPLIILLLLSSALLLSGCAGMLNALVPDVHIADRHTVMEADAAGEWPELEQRLRYDLNRGPQPLPDLVEPLEQQATFRVLNDEFVMPTGETKATEGTEAADEARQSQRATERDDG
ncbi:hypothetical protein CKO15_08550 [Halorhodospira abdelmalekii]|uniref:hypothetical protein n=1 Tax=Halorhodospira abdelmalekii TaxID=421629 RepID=UPI00190762B6|nr:hypothetical protein [Halorhodospira abdelmalekii]MBK1735330.1 hypothetical protein [Halorhodospira abdelmalekii]